MHLDFALAGAHQSQGVGSTPHRQIVSVDDGSLATVQQLKTESIERSCHRRDVPIFTYGASGNGERAMNNQPPGFSVRRGYLYTILAAICWAVSGSSAKFLFNSGVTPFQLVQLRITIATAGLLIWLAIRSPALLKIDRKDIGYFALFGSIGMGACQFTYMFAISRINVAAAILLQYLAPSFIAIYAVVFARDRLKPSTVAALLGATLGCYLVVGAYNLQIVTMNWAGIVSGVLSAVTFAWYSIHGEYGMRRYSPWTVLFYALLFAAVVWNIVHPPLESFFQPYALPQWGWIVYIGIMGTLVPFGLYLQGVNLIRSTRASITATLEPITAGALSFVFLNETMDSLQIAGGLLVIASIILLQLKQEADEKAPALMRARRQNS